MWIVPWATQERLSIIFQPSSHSILKYGDNCEFLFLFSQTRMWGKKRCWFSSFQTPEIHFAWEPYAQNSVAVNTDVVNLDEMNTVKMHFNLWYPGYLVTIFFTILSSSKHIPQALLFHNLFFISIHLSCLAVLFALYYYFLPQKMQLPSRNLCASSITPLFKILTLSVLFEGNQYMIWPGWIGINRCDIWQ